jgi:hypothetical protein
MFFHGKTWDLISKQRQEPNLLNKRLQLLYTFDTIRIICVQPVPFLQTASAAGPGRMLTYKDGMVSATAPVGAKRPSTGWAAPFWCTSHGCLLSIILWLGICQTLADDLCRMGADRFHAFLFYICEICFL